MDRFIAKITSNNIDNMFNLKSNMDRFIVYSLSTSGKPATHLKSNMDRFIERLLLYCNFVAKI